MLDHNSRPVDRAEVITPSVDGSTPHNYRAVYVGTAGNLDVTTLAGSRITFHNLAAGVVHPISIRAVWSGGTTAAQIVGIR